MNLKNYKKIFGKIAPSFLLLSILSISFLNIVPAVNAQSVQTLSAPAATEDPTSQSFKIIICDGPAGINDPKNHTVSDPNHPGQTVTFPTGWKPKVGFIACDFNGAMIQVQHIINIMMVLGVLAAIVLFTYAGFLMMKGTEADRSKAKDIFPKIFFGFVIMLSAWFIVYQVLSWLTGNGTFTKLLGNP